MTKMIAKKVSTSADSFKSSNFGVFKKYLNEGLKKCLHQFMLIHESNKADFHDAPKPTGMIQNDASFKLGAISKIGCLDIVCQHYHGKENALTIDVTVDFYKCVFSHYSRNFKVKGTNIFSKEFLTKVTNEIHEHMIIDLNRKFDIKKLYFNFVEEFLFTNQ